MASVLDENIQTLIRRRRRENERLPPQERLAERITNLAGSMKFVYLHALLFGLWLVINLPFIPLPKFDPTYVVLAMFASVEAIFISTFVLIRQNRMAAVGDQRDDLHLQISLLAEHEVTRLIELVTAIGARLDVKEATEPDLEELKQRIGPEKVLDSIDAAASRAAAPQSNSAEPLGDPR